MKRELIFLIGLVVLIAARLGSVRLIDNLPFDD